MFSRDKNRISRRKPLVGFLLVAILISSGCLGFQQPEPIIEEEKFVSAEIELDSEPTTSYDFVKADLIISEGVAPFIISWSLNGQVVQTSSAIFYEAGFLDVGTHTIEASITDAEGSLGNAAIIFSLVDPNRAPTVSLELPEYATAGLAVDWSAIGYDADGDELSISVDFGDGVNQADWSGSHIFAHQGQYIVRVMVEDTAGFTASAQKAIRIDPADAPILYVDSEPYADGRISLNLVQEMVIMTSAEDPLGLVSIRIDWGDGLAQEPVDAEEHHQYENEGKYTITVTARGQTGVTSQRLIHIEVVGSADNLEASQLQEDIEDEGEEALESELGELLDENEDGIVDEASEADDETQYDWEADFDPDADGEMDDENEINAWQTKDDSELRTQAGEEVESQDVTDSLLTEEDNMEEDELTLSSAEDSEIITAHTAYSSVVNPVMNAAWAEVKDEATDNETYSRSVHSVTSTWWNTTHYEDWDGDGVAEVICHERVASFWYDNGGIIGPEIIYLWRVYWCANDRDGDGVDDQWYSWHRGLTIRDQNSNGLAERYNSYNYSVWSWQNGTQMDRNWIMNSFGYTDLNEDGNLERYIAYNRTSRLINTQGTWWPLTQYYSEMTLIWRIDYNDDGTNDVEYIVDHSAFRSDPNEDGNRDTRRDSLNSVMRFDRDQDGNIDLVRSVQQSTIAYDNNSDGEIELFWTYRIAVLRDDVDRDGDFEHVVLLRSWSIHWDWGVIEYNIDTAFTRDITDDDVDGNPEIVKRTYERTNGTDLDIDPLLERQDSINAEVRKYDPDSDGIFENVFRRVKISTELDEHSNGFTKTDSTQWSVWVWRNHQTDDIRFIRTTVNVMDSWDNNSDGIADTSRAHARWWNAFDWDNDGFLERRSIVFYNWLSIDDDADGNISLHRLDSTYHLRVFDQNGTLTSAWYMHYNIVRHNVSWQGFAFFKNATWVAWSWDSSNGWQHVITVTWLAWDYNQDGVIDDSNYTSAQQNTPP